MFRLLVNRVSWLLFLQKDEHIPFILKSVARQKRLGNHLNESICRILLPALIEFWQNMQNSICTWIASAPTSSRYICRYIAFPQPNGQRENCECADTYSIYYQWVSSPPKTSIGHMRRTTVTVSWVLRKTLIDPPKNLDWPTKNLKRLRAEVRETLIGSPAAKYGHSVSDLSKTLIGPPAAEYGHSVSVPSEKPRSET